MHDPGHADEEDITQLLHAWSDGKKRALDKLIPIVYDHLRRLAHARLHNERTDHTLNTTALVHEAYTTLAELNRMEWRSRTHFMNMASRVMRRVLIDYAKRRKALKRGGDMKQISLNVEILPVSQRSVENVIDLDKALSQLGEVHPRATRAIECRYFGGLTLAETAEALDISISSVKRDQRFARAWLARALSSDLGQQQA